MHKSGYHYGFTNKKSEMGRLQLSQKSSSLSLRW